MGRMSSAFGAVRAAAIALLIAMGGAIPGLGSEADTRVVKATFERCEGITERVDRSLRRYESDLAALQRGRKVSGASAAVAQELPILQSRKEYFRGRFDRVQGMADKIRDELRSAGATCPSCTQSSVSLYCRSVESLRDEIDEYLRKAAELRMRAGLSANPQAAPSGSDPEKAALDSLLDALSARLTERDDAAITVLVEQARVNRDKASQLEAKGDIEGARRARQVARTLLDNAKTRIDVP